MLLLYNLGIRFYHLLIVLLSPFNSKAKLWLGGRKSIFKKIASTVNPNASNIWIHCSSLGEFEQGRPVIETIKERFPDKKIVLTFFSPSGYEVRKNYKGADFVFYLPLDTRRNAQRFLQLVNPTIAIFVKYEFWYHYLNQLKRNGISTYIVSANFRPGQVFFKKYGGWYRKFLLNFSYFFVQNEQSKALLASIGISNVTVTGDTRFDRVAKIAVEAKSVPVVENFCKDSRVIVAGSTWPKDEEILFEYLSNAPEDVKLVIAPHEVGNDRINSIIQKSPFPVVCYSNSEDLELAKTRILVIDTIGLLSSLYRYGIIAYIGGGFGVGIHNTLEAAVYGVPVIFGPKYHKFQEAKDLIAQGAGFSINSSFEFVHLLNNLLSDRKNLKEVGNKAGYFVNSGLGATAKIVDSIFSSEK
ncbi:MAG TPA: glycosyltransferase N-terminal domain-containing protein [Tenuifilaceae bacterium]|nr:glycosyltransferase N-terminal domain-containing protein [Tenuifilaceae bacterium]